MISERERISRFWEPSKQLIASIRSYDKHRDDASLLGTLRRKIAVTRHRFWSIVTHADIPVNSRGLGNGLLLPHPVGIVVHPDAVIGKYVLLFQGVTLGTGSVPGVPTIGEGSVIGAGAKILGGVTIGSNVKVGANAVVVDDVPSNCTVVGIPARIVKDRKKMTRDAMGRFT